MSMPEKTDNGIVDIIFKSSDYYGVIAKECLYKMIGKFFWKKPIIYYIHSLFAEKIYLKGDVKIGAYDFLWLLLMSSMMMNIRWNGSNN